MKESACDVLVCGAGLTGCATAKALMDADSGHRRRVIVVDKHRGPSARFSGEFIHPRGAQVLDDLGLLEPLLAAGAIEVDGFVAFEAFDGTRVDLPYADVPYRRARGLSVHHKVLVAVLREVITKLDGVTLLEGTSLVQLERDASGRFRAAVVEGPEGRHRIAFGTLVGADGKGSTTRKLAGLPDRRETIGFTAGIELYDAPLPAPTSAHVFLGAWGPILAYPILRRPDGTVVSRMTFDLPRALPAKGRALARHLRDAFVPHLPPDLARCVLEALDAGQRIEIAATVNLPAPRAAFRGLVLAGDAAGCSHPITASGMTMGLRDAELLGQEAASRAPEADPWLDDAALAAYRAGHDRYVPTRQALADAIYEAFRGETEGARAIRRALFAYWQKSPQARQRSMALLSCVERRPHVFLTEYLKTARYALESGLRPRHAVRPPWEDRVDRLAGAAGLAREKLGLVARVMWAQVRPSFLSRVA